MRTAIAPPGAGASACTACAAPRDSPKKGSTYESKAARKAFKVASSVMLKPGGIKGLDCSGCDDCALGGCGVSLAGCSRGCGIIQLSQRAQSTSCRALRPYPR